MKKDIVNTRVLPDTRRAKKEGRYPLKLRITYKGERRYYGATSRGFVVFDYPRFPLDSAYSGATIFLLQIKQIIFKFVV